jgi:poly(3-hydroxybutyrate) depolymerase
MNVKLLRCRRQICFLFLLGVVCMACRKTTPVTVIDDNTARVETHKLVAVPRRINAAFGGYYVAFPPHYFTSSEKFPLLLFLHGLGQMGNGGDELHFVVNDGIGKLLVEKRFPAFVTAGGKNYSFVVVSPQSNRPPSVDEVMQLVDYMRQLYSIDEHRLYLSGLSLGAKVVTLVAARYPEKFAAIVPIAGVAGNAGMEERCEKIAKANLPVWELHNADDPMASVTDARRFIHLIGSFHPGVPPRFTVFDVYGHDAWTKALDPAYRETGMNIYEWMLQYNR